MGKGEYIKLSAMFHTKMKKKNDGVFLFLKKKLVERENCSGI